MSRRAGSAAAGRPLAAAQRSSVRLGLTLRTMLVRPAEGFEGAVSAAERRARTGATTPEGASVYVLAAAGGAALMLTWLKVSGLLGVRALDPFQFRWSALIAALTTGALVALIAQFVWGMLGPRVARPLGGEVSARNLRIVWGLAAFPAAFALLVLLPLDLIVVGPELFATVRLSDSVSTAWAAVSVALTMTLTVWSAVLFARGVGVIAGLSVARTGAAVLAAGLVLAAATSAAGGLLILLAGLPS